MPAMQIYQWFRRAKLLTRTKIADSKPINHDAIKQLAEEAYKALTSADKKEIFELLFEESKVDSKGEAKNNQWKCKLCAEDIKNGEDDMSVEGDQPKCIFSQDPKRGHDNLANHITKKHLGTFEAKLGEAKTARV